MKLKLITVATVVALGLISTANADDQGTAKATDQGHGKITFTGSIIDAPCSIKAGDEEQLINLGQVSNVALQNQGKSTPVPFEIRLENCQFGSPAAKNKVTVTFTGAASSVDANLLGISGSAKGAGVALTTQGGSTLIKLGTPTQPQLLEDGPNTLSFAAYMQGESENTPIVEGGFTAVTDFKLNYN